MLLAASTASRPDFPIAEAMDVSKRFGGSQALQGVSITINAGESRALVGRNGAGKSTLVGLLTGILRPDTGSIRFLGEQPPDVASPQRWRDRVACVYQKSTLIPQLTVAENLFLNSQPIGSGGLINWSRLRHEAQDVLDEWGFEIDVGELAGSLTVEKRHIVEIARALRQGTRFIILDEPTAELEAREVTRLFEKILKLRDSGVTFLYISHYLEEIYDICRTVTVLRDGRVVADAPLSEMPVEKVVGAMVGDAMRDATGRGWEGKPSDRLKVNLDVRQLQFGDAVRDVSFEVASGECVGLTGLVGSGKELIGDAIAGLETPSGGAIFVCGENVPPGNVSAAQKIGVGYVPRDRRARGIIPHLSVAENVTMTIIDRLGLAGFISPRKRDREAIKIIRSLEIVTSSPEQPMFGLSGGNQQKTVFGRALAPSPKVLVLVHPTQGVDIASKNSLFAIANRARAAGTAILIVSDDLDELVICDRVIVLFKGRIRAEFQAGWKDDELVASIEGFDPNAG